MENRAYALAVGLFTLLLGAGVVFAAMWLSGDTERSDPKEVQSPARDFVEKPERLFYSKYRHLACKGASHDPT